MIEPPSLEELIAEFSSLPGIGNKTARRLSLSYFVRPREQAVRFF